MEKDASAACLEPVTVENPDSPYRYRTVHLRWGEVEQVKGRHRKEGHMKLNYELFPGPGQPRIKNCMEIFGEHTAEFYRDVVRDQIRAGTDLSLHPNTRYLQ